MRRWCEVTRKTLNESGKMILKCFSCVSNLVLCTYFYAVVYDAALASLRRNTRVVLVHVREQVRTCVEFLYYFPQSLSYFFVFLGWRRGSVVRASVFNWRTFPGLRLIYG